MRRTLVACGVAVVALAAAVPIGRTEHASALREQLDRIDAVARTVGPPGSARLDAYRIGPGLACLVYRDGGVRWALELCWDGAGRLVESVDRRSSPPVYGSVTSEPAAARRTLSRDDLFAILRRRHVPEAVLADSGY